MHSVNGNTLLREPLSDQCMLCFIGNFGRDDKDSGTDVEVSTPKILIPYTPWECPFIGLCPAYTAVALTAFDRLSPSICCFTCGSARSSGRQLDLQSRFHY